MVQSYLRHPLPAILLLILLCAPSLCLGQEIGEILINGEVIDKAEGSKWLTDDAIVEVKDSDGRMRLSISVEPDSGLITMTPSGGFTVKVSTEDKSYEEQRLALGYSIKKFMVATRQGDGDSDEEFLVMKLCCDYEIKFGLVDVFLLPIAYKVVRKWPLSWIFPKKQTLTVIIEEA